MEDTAARLKQVLKEKGWKAIDLVNKCQPLAEKYNLKIGRNDISQYLSGKFKPGQYKLSLLAEVLDVNEAWLMGYDVVKSRWLEPEELYIEMVKLITISTLSNEQKNHLIQELGKFLLR